MTNLNTDLKCPHCTLITSEPIKYEDLTKPFLVKCGIRKQGGCGKYFAVKINMTLKAECCKIFEGAPSGKEGGG